MNVYMLTVLLVPEATLVVCQAECQVDQVDSQVLVDQVLLTTMDQLWRRSTKLFPTNLFSWFFAFATSCHGIIQQWHRSQAEFLSYMWLDFLRFAFPFNDDIVGKAGVFRRNGVLQVAPY
jgi:hypothetical protein